MEKKNTRVPIIVSFTKIIAYVSLFYSVALFFKILINLYRYFVTDNTLLAAVYSDENIPYNILLLGSVFMSAIHFYCIKKEKYNWIIVAISILLIGFTRIQFEAIYKYFS